MPHLAAPVLPSPKPINIQVTVPQGPRTAVIAEPEEWVAWTKWAGLALLAVAVPQLCVWASTGFTNRWPEFNKDLNRNGGEGRDSTTEGRESR